MSLVLLFVGCLLLPSSALYGDQKKGGHRFGLGDVVMGNLLLQEEEGSVNGLVGTSRAR